MQLAIVGPGRAGGALALAALRAGHRVVAVRPGPSGEVPPSLQASVVRPPDPLPPVDLLVLAVPDEAISPVARALAPTAPEISVAVHLSGFMPVSALHPLVGPARAVGSLHPLQSLPSPEAGAEAIPGSWAAVTSAYPEASVLLEGFSRSLGMRPFQLPDDAKPAYHAGAAAASNAVTAALAVAAELLESARVPFEAARPLTAAVLRNAFEMGPGRALTGPVARGDLATVEGHLVAADRAGVGEAYRALAMAIAHVAGTADALHARLGSGSSWREGPR